MACVQTLNPSHRFCLREKVNQNSLTLLIKMKNWFLYVIRCKNGRLYTGITTDVERRFAEHTSNDKKGAKCLRGKAPLTLVMKKKIGSRSMALQIEAKVKKLSKIKKEMFAEGKIKIKEL